MLNRINANKSWIVVSVFLLMTFFGLLITPDYGMSGDELLEIRTLGTNIREYAGAFLYPENEPLNTFYGIPFTDSQENSDIDHGQSLYYPLTPFLFMDLGVEGPRTLMTIFHAYTFILFMLGVAGLYFLAQFLTGDWKYGLLAACLLYLSPRFFAEGHYNPKDIVVMSMIILCFWFFIKMSQERRIRYAILFALFGALATNMRVTGMFFFCLAGLFYLLKLTVNKEWNRKSFLLGLLTVLIFLSCYYVLTPVAWKDPFGFIAYTFGRSSNYSDWPGSVFYMGALCRPVPWHYIPVMFATTTPILVVIMTLAGNLIVIYTIVRNKILKIFSGTIHYYLMTIIFVWTFLLFAILRQPVLYNSWRHYYFLYGPILILAVMGIKTIMDQAKGKYKKAVFSIVVLQLVISLAIIVANHPYQYVYYNIFAGADPGESYEMDYWNVSTANALKELINTTDNEDVITVTTADYYSFSGLIKGQYVLPEPYKCRTQVVRSPEGGFEPDADYILVNPLAVKLSSDITDSASQVWASDEEMAEILATYPEVVVLEAFGSDFMIIYKNPK